MRILIVDDEDIVHKTLAPYLCRLGHEVDHAYDGAAALESVGKAEYDLALLDVRMPRMSGLEVLEALQSAQPELAVVIITGHGTMETAVEALRLGAADFLTKPIKLLELDAVTEKALRLRRLRGDAKRLQHTISYMQASRAREPGAHRLIGESAATGKVREQIELAAARGFDTLLVTGETGTGKEVVAREIHRVAASEGSPFIAVSCPAIPESLIESELFGHVKGAFTGASEARTGSFEMADGGTLFLDEIADLSAAAQAKILRALETRTVRKVGGTREVSVRLRVVAATNVPLEELVEARTFRRDLYYRLNVFTIALAPLRERREDIVPIAEHFLAAFAAPRGLDLRGFTDRAKSLLTRHDFPGNARELRNVVERAAAQRGDGLVDEKDLPLDRPRARKSTPPPMLAAELTERARIQLALERTRWNRKEAAKVLEIPYSTLRYKIAKFGLK